MSSERLPPLRKISFLYLAVLMSMALGFYLLLIGTLALTAYLLCAMVLWTPAFIAHGGTGAIRLLLVLYFAVGMFGWAILQGLLARAGGDPVGIRADVLEHRKIFELLDEVAERVQAPPIHEVFFTPGDEIGVWEEAALYMPPGMGKRKIVLGMAALNYLTLDQLRVILAHEYGHFSNKDPFFSRFLFRVSNCYDTLLKELRGSRASVLNPFFWLLFLYVWIFERISAAFSRHKELLADRCAVEAYGRHLFVQALITSYMEGVFFSDVGLHQVLEMAARRHTVKNIYYFVGVSRQKYQRDRGDEALKIIHQMLAERTRPFDRHPALYDRLKAQNMPTALVQVSPPTRVIPMPELNSIVDPEIADQTDPGVPCAAEELFGINAIKIQTRLSDFVTMRSVRIIHRLTARTL